MIFSPSSMVGSRLRARLSWRYGLIGSLLALLIVCSSCALAGQQDTKPDPRLKSFQVVSSRIVILDTQAEVDGTVRNTGHDKYPYDVTMNATFYDAAGHVVGQAQGVAEDVWAGMTRPFVLTGQVNSAQYSRMTVVATSLHERRQEKNLPSPPPVVP